MTTKPIQIFKGDDTDFNYGNLVTFQFQSNLDLSTFTGAFELGEYKQVTALSNNSMTVNIPRNITSTFPYGTMYGVFRLIDTLGRVGTVSNTIEFYITSTPFTPESCVVDLEVPEGYPVTITMEIGFQNGDYANLHNKPSINGVTLEEGQTGPDLGLQNAITDLEAIREGAALGATAVQPAVLNDYATTTALSEGLATKQDIISDLQTIREGAALGATAVQPSTLNDYATTSSLSSGLAGKEDVISDLSTIRSGAALGATAVQPATLNDYATTSAVISGLSTKQDTLTTAQQNAVDSGIDSEKVGQISTNTSDITTIESKIPTQATSSNQLADKNFVNSSISTNTANFIGTFNSVADLEAYSGPLTNNDYAFVISSDSSGNTSYDRYKYTDATTPASWEYEYSLNNSSFTAAQWAAINSEITSALVTQIGTNQSNISSLQTDKLDASVAESTYLSQADASSAYLTKTDAASTYLGQGAASSTYLTQTDASSTYLTQSAAESTYLTKTSAGGLYVPLTAKGSAGGVATLDGSSLIPVSQIPVDGTTIVTSGGVLQAVGGGGDSLPSQSGHSGQYLTTDGTSASWATVSGGAPSIDWFTNKSGSSFDTGISGLASKQFVSVYKNGSLLQRGTFNPNSILYTGGYGKSVELDNLIDLSTATSWEIRTSYRFDTGASATYPTIFGTSGDVLTAPAIHFDGDPLVCYIAKKGDLNSRIVNGASLGLTTTMILTHKTFYVILAYNSTGDNAGYCSYYSENDFAYTNKVVLSASTEACECSAPLMFLNQTQSPDSPYYNAGSINMSDTKVYVNGNVVFDGSSGSGFTNNGCSTSVAINNDYGLLGAEIYFKNSLLTTDNIAVEVFG